MPKNQGNHQPTEITFCMSYFSHKSMPDAKFESGSLPSFEDMASQNFHLKKGTSRGIRIFTPGKWFNLKKRFYVQNRSSGPKIYPPPPCQFQQFSSRGNVFIFKII